MIDPLAGLYRRFYTGLDRLSPELLRPSCQVAFVAQCAQPLHIWLSNSARSTQRAKSSGGSRAQDAYRHYLTLQNLPRSERRISLTEFLAICCFFMTVQAVEVIFHHVKAVCNSFIDRESRGKSVLFCEDLAWTTVTPQLPRRTLTLAQELLTRGVQAIKADWPS